MLLLEYDIRLPGYYQGIDGVDPCRAGYDTARQGSLLTTVG